jgi:hypothetical protein
MWREYSCNWFLHNHFYANNDVYCIIKEVFNNLDGQIQINVDHSLYMFSTKIISQWSLKSYLTFFYFPTESLIKVTNDITHTYTSQMSHNFVADYAWN